MKPAHNLIIIATIIGIIVAVSGSIVYVFSKTSPQTNETQLVTQSRQEITQKPSDEEGKVLSGGCVSPKVKISNNVPSPTTIEAKYYSSAYFKGDQTFGNSLYEICIGNLDEAEKQIVKHSWPAATSYASTTLCPVSEGFSCSSTTAQFKVSGTYKFHLASNPGTVVTIKAGNTSASQTTIVDQSETIKDVTLPSVFSAKGSKTTDLSKLSDTSKVKKFTLDVVGKNRIVFTDTVNLSSDKARDLFKKLDKYVKITKLGVVEVDSKTLSMIAKKKATVSMFKLPFLDTPDILVNGKADTKKTVSGVKYEKGTLTFSVKNFSKFEAVPKLEILEPKNSFVSEQESITLKGKISDSEASVSAKLNGQSLGNIKVATKSGEFSKDLDLKEGRNNIIVNAISSLGPPLEATVSGIFLPPIEIEGYSLGTTQIASIGILILLLLAIVGGWLYHKKRKAS